MTNEPKKPKTLLNEMIVKNTKYKTMNLWELDTILSLKEDECYLLSLFSVDQLKFIRGLVQLVVEAMDWHETYEETHLDIRKEITELNEKLENHRHELKPYSGKAKC